MKIGLLGHGVVGRGVTEIIDGHFPQITVSTILVKDLSEGNDPRYTTDAYQILNDPQIDVVIECMGGIEPAFTYVRTALENGKHAVTSNKKMLAYHLKELAETAEANHRSLRFEASCGGCIPWIHELERTQRIDQITSFRGIMNGTTNYILSDMTGSCADFNETLKEAQKLGYAEADPSDDIDGNDVAYKCCISAFSAFHKAFDPDEVPHFGIRHLKKDDIAYAKANGRVIKLIGRGCLNEGKLSVWVMPVMLKGDDPMCLVSSNLNRIELSCRTLGTASFGGQGAGSLPTAHAVVQDVLSIAESGIPKTWEASENHIESVRGTYYVSGRDLSLFEPVCAERHEGWLLTREMSLQELSALMQNSQDVFVCEVSR
ncbi:MAG: homoserine dehydrogenase [Solobacterium sp.]|nr:homoserine dehydrogenase [Solobacterium sp.]